MASRMAGALLVILLTSGMYQDTTTNEFGLGIYISHVSSKDGKASNEPTTIVNSSRNLCIILTGGYYYMPILADRATVYANGCHQLVQTLLET